MYPLFETSFFSNFKLDLRNSLLTVRELLVVVRGSVQLRRCEHVVDAHPQHHN